MRQLLDRKPRMRIRRSAYCERGCLPDKRLRSQHGQLPCNPYKDIYDYSGQLIKPQSGRFDAELEAAVWHRLGSESRSPRIAASFLYSYV
jgi:hypothetical protein